jgi:N-acetylneuraminate synthase
VTRNIKAKNPIQALDFEEPEEELSEKMLSFAMHRKIAIPIRLYDCDFYFKNINTNFFEFHLSYGEVLSDELFNLLKMSELKGKSFSIHLPDYIHGNRIIDPISDDVSIRNESVDLISRVIDFSRKLEDISGNSVPIVGSFSESKSSSRRKNLDRIFNYLDTSQGGSGKILPQWLPVYAWYFGGSAKLDIFNSLEDIEYIKEYDRKLCLDICHLVLSANYYKKDPMDWFELLKYHSSHVHIADGIGVDGEGLQLGEGQLKEYKKFLEIDAMKVLEVWQGHHNHGNGFIKAIRYLYNEK